MESTFIQHISNLEFWIAISPIMSALGALLSALTVCYFSFQSNKIQKENRDRDKLRLYYERHNRMKDFSLYFAKLTGTITGYLELDIALFSDLKEKIITLHEETMDSYLDIAFLLQPEERSTFSLTLNQIKKAYSQYSQDNNETNVAANLKSAVDSSKQSAETLRNLLYIERQG